MPLIKNNNPGKAPLLGKLPAMVSHASRLQGEPADGVEDHHFHPTVPRLWRLGLRVAI
jgi:hypothetical protein